MALDKGFYTVDKGHKYIVNHIDGLGSHTITFVKRCGKGYPGNIGFYEGTTLQIVLRVLIDRVQYLNNQKNCLENRLIMLFLKSSIWLLEFRAARRHSIIYKESLNHATFATLCDKCGHTVCNC